MKTLLFFPILLLFTGSFAQNNDSVKLLHTEIENLKKLNEDLSNENRYLKQTLKIFQPIQSSTFQKIEFNILSVDGEKSSGTVVVTLNIINHGINRTVQLDAGSGATAIDIQSNAYKTTKYKVGTEAYADKIYNETPLKMAVTFKDVLPSALFFKLFSLKGFTSDNQVHLENYELNFKDLRINWH